MCDSAYVRFRHARLCAPADKAHRLTVLGKLLSGTRRQFLRSFDGTARPTALQTTGELT
jgi:hypothetical protein